MSEGTKIRMHPERGHYDKGTLYEILDQSLVCHVAFSMDGSPFCLPMTYARVGDSLFIHASTNSRIYRELSSGAKVCVTVTMLDGIVLAKSIFHNSMNYRSAVILGKMSPIEDRTGKMEISRFLTEKLIPGRWEDSRIPSDKELDITGFLELKIEEFSSKVRSGPPVDDPGDRDLKHWTGLIPISMMRGTPIPSGSVDEVGTIPAYLATEKENPPDSG